MSLADEWGLRRTYYIKKQDADDVPVQRPPAFRHLRETKMSNDPTQLPQPRVEAFYLVYYVMGYKTSGGVTAEILHKITNACLLSNPTRAHFSVSS